MKFVTSPSPSGLGPALQHIWIVSPFEGKITIWDMVSSNNQDSWNIWHTYLYYIEFPTSTCYHSRRFVMDVYIRKTCRYDSNRGR